MYRSCRLIEGKVKCVVVDEKGKIINKDPTKEELEGLDEESCERKKKGRFANITEEELLESIRRFYKENGRIPIHIDLINNHKYPSNKIYVRIFGSLHDAIKMAGLWDKRYNETNTCDRCGKNFNDLAYGHPLKEYDEKGDWTGKWDCPVCRSKYDPNSTNNIIKSLANCRTGNQNPNHESAKGEKCVDLACKLYDWVDLNKKYDNYVTEIDCLDEKTGLYYQIRGICYSPKYGWYFGRLEGEWYKKYEDIVCFCKSRDGNRIEVIYRFPFNVIEGRKDITIHNNPRIFQWYDKYRVEDYEELRKANEIWKKILEKS